MVGSRGRKEGRTDGRTDGRKEGRKGKKKRNEEQFQLGAHLYRQALAKFQLDSWSIPFVDHPKVKLKTRKEQFQLEA